MSVEGEEGERFVSDEAADVEECEAGGEVEDGGAEEGEWGRGEGRDE